MMKIKHIVIIFAVLMTIDYVNAEFFFDTKNIANGEYTYTFDDGLYSKDETGTVDGEGNPVITGQYRYVVGDKEYVVTYTADKDGYHPKVTITDYEEPYFAAPPALVASLLGK